MTAPDERAARILIALSATDDARLELDVYRYLLGEAPPEIVGLIVEDPALFALAASRLAREIVLSGMERRLEPQALERQLRARQTAWRRLLEAESARLGFRVAFETMRAERRAALARAAAEADALIVDAAALRDALDVWSHLAPAAPLKTLVLAPARRRTGDIVAVIDEAEWAAPADSPGPALSAALRVAQCTGSAITVLALSSAPGPALIAGLLRRAGVRLAEYAPLAGVDARRMAAYARDARLVVLPRTASADARLIGELTARLRGALMLLRSAKPEPPAADQ